MKSKVCRRMVSNEDKCQNYETVTQEKILLKTKVLWHNFRILARLTKTKMWRHNLKYQY